MAADVHFLYPGDLATPTGGYAYDRRLIGALREAGVAVEAMSLGDGYPDPTASQVAAARAAFAGLPDGAAVIIDGLAYGVLDDVARAECRRLKLVALVHHPLALETGVPAERARALRDAEREALKQAAAILTTSHATADTLAADYEVAREKITVIEPGLDRAERASGRPAGEGAGILSVGSIIPRKDHATLISALAGLREEAWHLDIVGDGTRHTDCRRLLRQQIERFGLSDRVTLHGALTPEALDAHYRRADIFALTTAYEGYGMAFAEAMARGLPVVATGEGAVGRTVPAEAGFVLKAGDVDAVREALRRLIAEAELRHRMGEAAFRHASGLPGWADAARTLTDLLETLE
ncbi:glycosyltransferase family 4 protein [Stappia sp. F7233]|uniref:Glycosyltransferase family 4 protein n=1 Tax=Stappia albiluteola TaxID=2758565 RepID=A0A839A9X6_9HYPH|nr:glycosyltransferase family 4 protein [Stappia albiluteola]MBA5775915.1 glycosyltransferase family 4 protein [Stappia albiluteola]